MLNDQAKTLREAVQNSDISGEISMDGPKVICVSSGKGGVGKSNFTTNIAIELKNRGNRVVIIDADFGLANVEILFGVVSNKNFLDLMENDTGIKDIITYMENGIGLISGGSGILELANVNEFRLNKVVNSIEQLKDEADYILIDTGAGISNVVTAFAHMAHEVVVVTTCEPTSVADAYALVKSLTSKNAKKNINIVVNKAESSKEADSVFNNINSVSNKFIKKDLKYLGFIYEDAVVSKAVKKQTAFIELMPNSKPAKCIKSICDKITDSNDNTENFKKLVDRFRGLFR